MKEKSLTLSYVCAVVYTLIFIGFSIFIYSIDESSWVGLILAILFSIAMGIAIAIGGFYLIIIPLPYISLYKGGCLSLTNRLEKGFSLEYCHLHFLF